MPHGPHKITQVRQVAIPGELLRAVGLELGDNVHFRLSESDPHVIEIVPSDIVARRYQAGADEALERLEKALQPLTTCFPARVAEDYATQMMVHSEPRQLACQHPTTAPGRGHLISAGDISKCCLQCIGVRCSTFQGGS